MSEQLEQKARTRSKEELLIDLSADRPKADETTTPDGARKSSQTSPTSPGDETPTKSELEIKEDHFQREHVVDARDTLDKVAAMYDTTPTRLAQYNKLTSRFIFAGQV
jgi:LysM repeat protein